MTSAHSDLITDARNYLGILAPHMRERQGSVLIQALVDALERGAPQLGGLSDDQIMDIAEPFHDVGGVKFDEAAFARELLSRAARCSPA